VAALIQAKCVFNHATGRGLVKVPWPDVDLLGIMRRRRTVVGRTG
jgi:hypothetical protein